MKKKIQAAATDVLCLWMIISMVGCSMAWEPSMNPKIDDSELLGTVARIVDEQWEVVRPVLEEELGEQPGRGAWEDVDGATVVERTLSEEQGRQYVQFCHAVGAEMDVEAVVSMAQELLPADQAAILQGQLAQAQRSLYEYGEMQSRALPPSQRAPFMRDLQKLVTKTLVLMVAGIVYACIPNTIFWGKVTAASAISVAAGIVATTVLSIYRYYKYSPDALAISFEEWIVDVTTDPAAAYAVATSMINVGKTMKNGPVVTGLIIVVFSIYQVLDMVKPMLKKYNFNA